MDNEDINVAELQADDNTRRSGFAAKLLKYSPAMLSAVLFLICLIFFKKADIEDVLNYTPSNVFLAAAVLWLFYALKSMSIIFPATVFFIVAGHIYPYPIAVLVNLTGMAISFAIPYHVGKISGTDTAQQLIEKFPAVKRFTRYAERNCFFASYAARAVTVLPNDLVSILYGSMNIPLKPFIAGSLLGLAPEMLVETFIGGKLGELSPKAILVLAVLFAVTFIASSKINKAVVAYGERKKVQK